MKTQNKPTIEFRDFEHMCIVLTDMCNVVQHSMLNQDEPPACGFHMLGIMAQIANSCHEAALNEFGHKPAYNTA